MVEPSPTQSLETSPLLKKISNTIGISRSLEKKRQERNSRVSSTHRKVLSSLSKIYLTNVSTIVKRSCFFYSVNFT